MDVKASQELWNTLSKAVPGKFHRSYEHSKRKCLQHRANFHKSWVWQILLHFTDITWLSLHLMGMNPHDKHWFLLNIQCHFLTVFCFISRSMGNTKCPIIQDPDSDWINIWPWNNIWYQRDFEHCIKHGDTASVTYHQVIYKYAVKWKIIAWQHAFISTCTCMTRSHRWTCGTTWSLLC